ncbi:MAG: Sapep family Mn(2+)-dependent dipeptidase [Coriobacteriaceae bacterium]|nr:Sapep family Mn(2+)-dependent dipeptidase [Coriobacteriaceae bacterium]
MDACRLNDVEAYVDEVWEDVVRDISSLVSHPSVADSSAAAPAAPFGRPVRDALDCALAIADRLGYATGDDEGYVGFADIAGERADQVATIAHVDVVPAGPGWGTDPFSMERREGWLLGRGVIDDKGPAVLSLYAGAYLIKRGITPRYTFRALIGCDEEVGMTDVHHYLENHPQPKFLFTPDAEFPVCNAEKGCFGGTFMSAPIEGGAIASWSGAEATNAIPSESVCVLNVPAQSLPEPHAHAERLSIEPVGEGCTRIFAQGIGGHASMPEGTVNAIGLVVTYLREIANAQPDLFASVERSFLELLASIHEDTAGTGLAIASESPAFGPLTCNAGAITVQGGRIEQTIDVRFPDSIAAAEMTEACRAAAAAHGAEFMVGTVKEPFSVSADSPAVQALLDTYAEVTGKDAKPFSMGGGTYARNFASAVSFGPEDSSVELPAWAGTMHGPNEAASEELLRDALKMYILAILRLNELEL